MNKILQYSIFILLFIVVGIFVSGTTTITDYFINITNGTGYLNLNGQNQFTIQNFTFLNNNISWENLNNYPVACPNGTYLTQLNDSVICSSITAEIGNFTNINANNLFLTYTPANSQLFTGANITRPLFWPYNDNYVISVCPSGCNYTTIQAAVNQIPILLNNRYAINISPGTYNEDVIVPYSIVNDLSAGDIAARSLSIFVNCNMNYTVGNYREIVYNTSVKSMQIIGSSGTMNPSIYCLNFYGQTSYANENVSIVIAGTQHASLSKLSFVNISSTNSALLGMLIYSSGVTVGSIYCGNNSLKWCIETKHGGEIFDGTDNFAIPPSYSYTGQTREWVVVNTGGAISSVGNVSATGGAIVGSTAVDGQLAYNSKYSTTRGLIFEYFTVNLYGLKGIINYGNLTLNNETVLTNESSLPWGKLVNSPSSCEPNNFVTNLSSGICSNISTIPYNLNIVSNVTFTGNSGSTYTIQIRNSGATGRSLSIKNSTGSDYLLSNDIALVLYYPLVSLSGSTFLQFNGNNTAKTCSGANTGILYYNNNTYSFDYCNGKTTKWNSFLSTGGHISTPNLTVTDNLTVNK